MNVDSSTAALLNLVLAATSTDPSTTSTNNSTFSTYSISSSTISSTTMVSPNSTSTGQISSTLSMPLQQLSTEAQDFYVPSTIRELEHPPSPIEFLRDYVMPNIPVVVRGGIRHWPAITKWTDDYLLQCLGNKQITVAMTPNGYADAPIGKRFVQPDEHQMTFEEFLKILMGENDQDIAYVQKQNSSFTDEFCELLPDTAKEISWASEAFGCQPDAINFWMGGERSVTSMHKDPYENMYAVVRGEKTFILQPPTDLHCIPYELYTAARYKKIKEKNTYSIIDELNEECCSICKDSKNECKMFLKESRMKPCKDLLIGGQFQPTCSCHMAQSIPWVAIDPLNPNFEKYPKYRNSTQLTVTISPGDLLYLPSLWFHHVQQKNGTIAVNYWYDMQYDLKYVYYRLLERLTQPVLAGMS